MSTNAVVNVDELRNEAREILIEMADLKTNLGRARSDSRFGRYEDSNTFRGWERRLAELKIRHQDVLLEISNTRRSESRRRNEINYENIGAKRQAFIEVCKQRLAPELFQLYWDEANKIVSSQV